MKRIIAVVVICLLSGINNSTAQQSGPGNYRASVHNGNRVKTVFGNWGVIGQPSDTRPRGAWIYSSNGYIGDVSLFVVRTCEISFCRHLSRLPAGNES